MKLEIGKTYFLVFIENGERLTYTATITALTDEDVEFKDKFGDEIGFKREYLVSKKEVR